MSIMTAVKYLTNMRAGLVLKLKFTEFAPAWGFQQGRELRILDFEFSKILRIENFGGAYSIEIPYN